MAAPTPAPAIPSASDLAALDPAVAISLLVVVALGIVGFYLGPALRDRLSRATPTAAAQAATGPAARADPPADTVDRTNQFITHLLGAIADARARIDELEHRLSAKDREIDDLQQQIHRLQMWQQQGRPG